MTRNSENRNRVQPGVPSGGQFAAELHGEPDGVTLTRPAPSPFDQAAVTALGDIVRTEVNIELGTWQRRMDKGRRGYEHEPPEKMPALLAKAIQDAENFEALPVDEQRALLDAVQLKAMKHILEPGQRLGTDTIDVAEGLDPADANLALTLASQKQVTDARLPGVVTLIDTGDTTVFDVRDQGIKHLIRSGSGYMSLAAEPDDDDQDYYNRSEWLGRARGNSAGRTILRDDRSADIASNYKDHHAYAVLMDTMADSPFREHHAFFGEMNRDERTVELTADGTEVELDVKGETPILRAGNGADLHPSMTAGFLSYMAEKTGRPDGETFASELREVFRDAERRLIR